MRPASITLSISCLPCISSDLTTSSDVETRAAYSAQVMGSQRFYIAAKWCPLCYSLYSSWWWRTLFGFLGCCCTLNQRLQRNANNAHKITFLTCKCYFQIQHCVSLVKVFFFPSRCLILHLSTPKLIYDLLAHLFRLMRPFRSWSPSVLNFTIQRSLLSAMNLEISMFATFYRSLKMMNKIGPSTHPWSTLLLSFLRGKNPLNPILWFWLSNQLSVHKKTFLQSHDSFVSLIRLL